MLKDDIDLDVKENTEFYFVEPQNINEYMSNATNNLKNVANYIKSLTIVDNLMSSVMENLPKDSRLKFLLGSIADDKILKLVGSDFDFVFHLATYHGNQS